MTQRSKITQLPRKIREGLEALLIEGNFSGYEALEKWLAERGYTIGKSSIHRYGANLEKKLAAIKASTEAAKLIARSAPDDEDQRSAAVISLIQTEVFDVLVGLQEAAESDPMKRAKLLSTVAKNVATLTRASVHQKKHEIEIRGKTQSAADRVARLATKGGLSVAAVENIKREILGIAA